LSQTIARKLGVNPYSKRTGVGNTADVSARPSPGSIYVEQVSVNESQVQVVCLFSQVGMGKPGAYSGSFGVPDSASDRLAYFREALNKVALLPFPPAPRARAVAMPWGIGCGLAGGDWSLYEQEINAFAKKHEIQCVLYRLV